MNRVSKLFWYSFVIGIIYIIRTLLIDIVRDKIDDDRVIREIEDVVLILLAMWGAGITAPLFRMVSDEIYKEDPPPASVKTGPKKKIKLPPASPQIIL